MEPQRTDPIEVEIERAAEVWQPLFADMYKWSIHHLARKDFSGTLATEENATDCATEAAIQLLKSHFPYDTDFKPWVHVIVQNVCQKFIQGRYKKSTVPDNQLEDIDGLLEQLSDPGTRQRGEQSELRTELLAALSGLSEARRAVIADMYFGGLSVEEISQKMGKSPGAIHSLHFNALHDLQKIMSADRDINNE